MHQARQLWQSRRTRTLAAVACVLAAWTCDQEAAGPGRRVALAVEALLPSTNLAAFNLAIDNVRLIVVHAPADTVFDQVYAFAADQTTLPISADVPLDQSPETFQVTIQMLSGTTVLFSGTQDVTLTTDQAPPPTQIPVVYSGPGQNVSSLTIDPPDSVLTQGGTLQFRLTARDGQGAIVPAFYASWSTSGSVAAAIDATGLLTAPFARGTISVQAQTPTAVSASTSITFIPAPIAITVVSGCGQSGAPGSPLPQPIVARVVAGDGLGVKGIQVQFTAPSGGSVATPTVITDANGLAQTLATLPPQAPAGFTISAAGLTTVPCSQTVLGATQLAFTVQPATPITAGTPFSVQVTAQDAQGGTVTSFNGNVTLGIGANPGGITFAPVTVAAVGGVATFPNVTITTTGVGYTLSATSGSLTPATSTPFDVTSGPPAQLAFAVQPTAVAPLVPIAPAVQVAVQDAFGNLVTTPTKTVTMSIGNDPAGNTLLGGSLVLSSSAGVATFADLTLDKIGNGFTLVASSPGLTLATSAPFPVTTVAGLHLVFTTQPSAVVAGSVITPAVVVTAEDAQNAVVPSFTGDVTLGFGTCSGATLSGTTTITAAAGVATFADLSVDKAGPCNLVAGSGGLQSVVSTGFTVSAGAKAKLAFTVEPSSVAAGATISPIVRVEIEDALGNVVPTATDNVVVALGANPGGALLSGTLTKAAAAGVALFTDLTLDKIGTGYTLVASSGTLAGATSTPFDVTNANGTHLVFTTQPTDVTAGVAIAPAVVVTAQDALNNTVTSFTSNVTLALGTCPAGAALSGTPMVPAAAGIATFNDLSIDKAGACTLDASAATLPNVTSASFTVNAAAPASVVKISGDNQTGSGGSALAQPLVVEVRDGFANPVQGATVDWATPSGGSFAPASGPTGVNGQAQSIWTLGPSAPSQSATATVGALTPASFSATANIGTPAISLAFAGIPGVGVGLSATVNVTLNTPAGAGGVSVDVTSQNTNLVSVTGSPVVIPQGQTAGTVTINGGAAGTTTITAQATGYTSAVLTVDVQSRAIALPLTINVPYGQTTQIPVQIGAPAPAGGVDIDVVSDNPSFVAVQASPLHINAGGLTVNATLIGVLPGSATITASNPAYNFATSTATTSAALNIVQTSATLNASFGTSVTINFESNNQPTAAPAPGITVNLVSAIPACLAVPPSVTITTGLVSTTANLTYGGGPITLPCTTTLTAQATNLTQDQVNVTVNPVPVITMFTPAQGTGRLGVGLQDQGSGSLQTANPGPGSLTVHLVSSNPAAMLLAPDAGTPGQPTLDIQVPINQSSFNYFIQGAGTGTATVTASAPAYTSGTTSTVTVVTPGFDIIGLVGATTSLSANDVFLIRLGVPNSTNTTLAAEQSIRAGSSAVTATVGNSNATAAQLVTTALTGQQVSVSIPVGQARSPGTVATGGVEFDPLGAGIDTVSASIPGFVIFPGAPDSVQVAVTAPLITMFTPAQGTGRLGVGLQDQGSGSLQVANGGPGSLTVHLVSSDAAVMLLAPDATTPGQPTLDVQVPITQSSFNYFIQGVGTGTATVTASAPAYTNGTTPTVNVVTPGFDIIGLTGATTSLAANDAFLIRVGVPNATNTTLSAEQSIRAGGSAVTATVRNSNATAAQLVTTALTGSQVDVTIPVGQARSPSTVVTGGVELDPLGAGTDTVSASIPGFVVFPGAPDSVQVTVTAPLITMFTPAQGTGRLGVGLQDQGSGSLQTANPGPGSLTVHLVSSDPAVMLLAPDAVTAGQPTLDVQVSINQSSFSYFIQGMGAGTATVTASAAAYTNGTTPTVNVVTPGFDIIGLVSATTSLALNDAFLIRVGAPNSANTALSAEQNIRAGGSAVTATIRNSNSAAAQLVTTTLTGQQVSVTIPVGQARSPSTVALGGVEFDPRGAGVDTVSASIPGFVIFPGAPDSVQVTVTAPLITMFTPAQGTGRLGAGLQDQGSGSLQTANQGPGPLTVHLVSSNPSIVLLAPDATTPGQPTLDVQVPINQSSFNYFIQGIENASGTPTITASASGYTNGTVAVTVAQPGFDIIGLTSATTTLAANDPFLIRLGVPNSASTALSAEQAIRMGGTAVTATVRNRNTSAAQLVTTALTGQQVSVTIPIGQARSPSTVGTGGVEYDPLVVGIDTVSASIPGFVIFPGAPDSVQVTVTTPLITMFTPAQGTGRLGAGLQDQGSGSLQTANPGPGTLTVHLVSSDPAVMLLAPDAATPGQPTLDVQVSINQSSFNYFVQGIATGTATVTASAPAYANGTTPTVNVVQPGFDILGLVTSISSQAGNDAFLVRLGAPNATNTTLSAEQSIRAGGSAVTATITTSSSTAAQLVTTATTGLQVSVLIAVGQARSPSTVVTGGVEFDPLAQGTTTVSATIPSYVAMLAGSVIVNVTP
jgi:hypothetical protein